MKSILKPFIVVSLFITSCGSATTERAEPALVQEAEQERVDRMSPCPGDIDDERRPLEDRGTF